jgi:hypothetical protein
MFALFNSARTSYEISNSQETPKKVADLVNDLEAQAINLLPREKEAAFERIAAIKTTAKTQEINNSTLYTGIQFTKVSADTIAGPIGLGIATFFTHDLEKKVENESAQVIGKSKKVAGQRRPQVTKKPKNKKDKAIFAAARSAIESATATIATSYLIATNFVKWGSSLFF